MGQGTYYIVAASLLLIGILRWLRMLAYCISSVLHDGCYLTGLQRYEACGSFQDVLHVLSSVGDHNEHRVALCCFRIHGREKRAFRDSTLY